MYDQEMFAALVASSFLATLDHCRFGCKAKKPTILLYAKANFADVQSLVIRLRDRRHAVQGTRLW